MTLLSEIAETSRLVASHAGKLAKARELAACLRRLAPGELAVAIPMLSGETRQARLGTRYATLAGLDRIPAASSATLTLLEADQALDDLAQAKGPGAAALRSRALEALFARATRAEQDFLSRLISGELRQGALRGVMLEAIASAAGQPAVDIRKAAMSAGGLVPVAQAALSGGDPSLAVFSIRLMQPLLPMLSQSAPDPATALKTLGIAAFERKLDGARIQVHKDGADVRVFTRNLNDVTAAVPEVADAVRASTRTSLILDGEAIAMHTDGTPYPFQDTMRRFGRKRDVDALRATLPLSAFFFDCLWLDGEALPERPAAERFEALQRALPANLLVPRIVTADAAEAARFMQDALARGHEGVMAKALDAPYEAGRRGKGWFKIKRARTLDLVVLAVEWGNGRRSGKLSNLHLGARDPAGGYVMLGKTFKGMTDEMLDWQTQTFLRLETGREGHIVHVRPEVVVEIAFDGLQASPRYPGGLALRFARVKGYRPDKPPQQADTIESVRRLYAEQRPG